MKHPGLRKALILCLCAVICLSLFPAPAQAAFTKTGNQAEDIAAYALTRVGKKDERSKMCAGFICTAAKAAGLNSSQINLNATLASPWKASGQFGFLTLKGDTRYNCKAFTWKDVVSGAYKPQRGDLVFYGYFSNYSSGTAKLTIKQVASKKYYHVHVGMMYDESSTKSRLKTVDGGQSKSGQKGSTWVAKKSRAINKDTGAVSGWKSSGHQIYVLEIIRPAYKTTNPPVTPEPPVTPKPPVTPEPPATPENYLDKCQKTDTYLTLTATTSNGYIMSLPCDHTNSISSIKRALTNGETLTATAIYKNHAGNYWYAVKASDGTTGYIYGGYASAKGAPSDAVSGNAKLATTTPKYGKALRISGTIKSKTLTIKTVTGVLKGSDGAKQTQTVTVNGTKLEIQPSDINMKLKFGKLKTGAGTLQLTVVLTGKDTNGSSLTDVSYTVALPVVKFKVVK